MMCMAYSKHRAHKLVEQKERWPDQLASEGPEGTHHRLSLPLLAELSLFPIKGTPRY